MVEVKLSIIKLYIINECMYHCMYHEIDQQSQLLDSKWEQVMAVPRVHCVQILGEDNILGNKFYFR